MINHESGAVKKGHPKMALLVQARGALLRR